MHLETSISIDFECRVPKSLVSAPSREDKSAVFKFKNKKEWTRRPVDWEALEDFLKIPRDSDNHSGFIAGRRKFYEKWGWLTTTSDQAKASENAATFAAFLNWMVKLQHARNEGELEVIDFSTFPFTLPDVPESFAAWRSIKIDKRIFQSPELKPKTLMNALLYMWLFGAQRLAKFRQCKRHQIVGRIISENNLQREDIDETRCAIWFYPSREDKQTCGRWCGDWMKNYNRKQKQKEQ